MKTKKRVISNTRTDQGFTLAEMVIAMGILAFVIVGMMQLFVYCSLLSNIAGSMTLAMSEAQSKMEEIKNHSYSSIVTAYASGGTPGDTFTLTDVTGTGTVAVTQVGPDVTSELLQIGVTVNWVNKDGRNLTATLVNMLAKR